MSRGAWLFLAGLGVVLFLLGWVMGRAAGDLPPGCGRAVPLIREAHPDPEGAAMDLRQAGYPAVQITDGALLILADEALLCEGSGHVVIRRPGGPAYFRIPPDVRKPNTLRLWRRVGW